jgi:NADH:ubiquinone oxidoreductase subunit H
MYEFIKNILNTTITYYNELSVLPHTLILIGVIMVPLLIVVAYYTYAERKIIASMQGRLGPNVVGPKGLLQPFADGVKLFFKEIVIPTDSNKFLFLLAPVITFTVAFAAWAVIPFDSRDGSFGHKCWLTICSSYDIIRNIWNYNRRLGFKFKICITWRHEVSISYYSL